MNTYFNIYQVGKLSERPQISYKIREYLSEFVINNILEKRGIIVGGKWKIVLALHFMPEGKYYTTEELSLAKGYQTVKQDGVKIYTILVPLKAIGKSDKPLLKTVELMYEAITKYFITNFKSISAEFMEHLKTEIDFPYLLSLPYPAPFKDQRYVAD